MQGFVPLHDAEQIGSAVSNFIALLPNGVVVLDEDFPHLGGGKLEEKASKSSVEHLGRHGRGKLDAIGQY